jgi:hypothetical protein
VPIPPEISLHMAVTVTYNGRLVDKRPGREDRLSGRFTT